MTIKLSRPALNLLFILVLLSGAVSLVQAQPSGVPTTTWSTECLGCGNEFYRASDHSLRLDAAGQPHIAYGGNHLYYAWFDGAAWQKETADTAEGVGEGASLGLDGAGYAHISYFDSTNADLKYAYQDAAGWHTQTLDSTQTVGEFTSLDVDAAGNPHITYNDSFDRTLNYVFRQAGEWKYETIATGSSLGFTDISMVLDGSGQPHLSYFNADGDAINYAYRDAGGNWQIDIFVDTNGPTGSNALALSASGQPHITYYDSNDGLQYTYKDAGGWHAQTVGSEQFGGDPSIAINGSGKVYISFTSTADELKLAVLNGAVWEMQTLEPAGQLWGNASLILDGSGYPLVRYDAYGTVKLAHQNASGWHWETVDLGSTEGTKYSAMVIDPQNHSHLVFSASGDNIFGPRDVRYAYQSEANWQVESVYHDCGMFTPCTDFALRLDSQGHAHLVFVDRLLESNVLYYAFRSDSGWQADRLTIGLTDLMGLLPSLVVDASNQPHLTYFDSVNGKIRYAYKDATGWHDELLDDGSSSSLALDPTGKLHAAYIKNFQLWYAYRDNAGWHTTCLDSATAQRWVFPQSLALDSANYPHIIHHFGSNSIDYAYQNASGWHIEVPLNTTSTGFYQASLALALDSANQPHIAYYDDDPNNLGYGYQDGSGWHFETVENLGTKIGSQLSLALDTTGKPRIIYYHNTEGLKLASTFSPQLQPVLYLPFVTK